MKHRPISRGHVLYVRVLGIILLPLIACCVYDFYDLFSLPSPCAFTFLKIYFLSSLIFDFIWLFKCMYVCSKRRNSLTALICFKCPNWLLIYFAVLIILVRSHISFSSCGLYIFVLYLLTIYLCTTWGYWRRGWNPNLLSCCWRIIECKLLFFL